MGICALCEEEKELCKSHFVPKFVLNWIKKTSATGYLRSVIDINKRVQDGFKENFLCNGCEMKFSKYEDYFARNIFYPYVEGTKNTFNYDENLQKFIMSLSWRMLKWSLKKFKKKYPKFSQETVKVEEKWRKLLLNDKCDEEYEHHFFLLDYIDESPEDLPDEFQSYIMRAVDGTIGFNSKRVFLFSKFPAMFFVSSIHPKEIPNLEGTLVGGKGIIKTSQICKDSEIGSFLIDRSKIGNKNPLSQREIERITKTMIKDLEKVKNSKTFELWKEEAKRK